MFEKLEERIPKEFTVVTHYTDELMWYESEQVDESDWERIDRYLTTSADLDKLRGVGFYPKTNTVKLSFNYNMKAPIRDVDKRLLHHRAFIKPPIDLLKVLYKYVPAEVHEFILNCRDKYSVKELPYDAGTWLMSIVLGARESD